MTVDERMRALLQDVEFPEPRHDPGQTIRIGRRRRAARWTAAVAAGAVMVAGVGAVLRLAAWETPPRPDRTTTGPTSGCEFERLPLPDGVESAEVTGIDPTGRYIVGYAEGHRSILWTDGEPRLLPAEAKGARAVSASGAVVGTFIGDGVYYSWVFRGESVEELPVPPAARAGSVTINAKGDVAGELLGDGKVSPIVWPADKGETYRILETPGDAVVRAFTDSGVLVGAIRSPVSVDALAPFRWDADGTGHPMALLPGASAGFAVDAAGDWATGKLSWPTKPTPGVFNYPPGGVQAVRWNLTTGEVTATGVDAQPVAVDRTGRVVIPEMPPRLIGPDKVVRPLPTDREFRRTAAAAISDNGVVAGMLTDSDIDQIGLLASPVPVRWLCPG